jgi:hypothetical protein
MHTKKMFVFVLSLVILPLLACNSLLPFGLGGGQPVTAAEIPVYPDATELKEGESPIGDTLSNNMEQDAAIREAMGALGGSGKIEQKGFQLPAEATWEQVKSLYSKDLEAAGWASGMGGLANSFIDVNAVMEAANQDNELFQTALWSKDKQTLTIIMMTDPTDQTKKQLIFSLSTP